MTSYSYEIFMRQSPAEVTDFFGIYHTHIKNIIFNRLIIFYLCGIAKSIKFNTFLLKAMFSASLTDLSCCTTICLTFLFNTDHAFSIGLKSGL